MYKKNKAGIYVYDTNTSVINNIGWRVNSIINTIGVSYNFKSYCRCINNMNYGFNLFYNVYKK